jgi:histidyl-tRNA synthetase
MRDLEPHDVDSAERVRSIFLEVCCLFDFKPMEPSTLELLSTLEAKSGSSIREEIYHFKDKSGREVGLRFDLTVGLARYVCSRRDLPSPVKLAAYSGNWRYDEPQYGRYRWFYQWDIEILGPKGLDADAEIIEFTSILFHRLGLQNVSIEIGDRRLADEFIRHNLKIENDDTAMLLLRAMDKLTEKPTGDILKEYSVHGIDEEILSRLIGFGKIRGELGSTSISSELEGLVSSHFVGKMADALKARSVPNVLLNMGIVRGLDYYGGFVFEVLDGQNRDIGALAGGGRYDNLTAAFGRPELGATGAAGGVERTLLALSKYGIVNSETCENLTFVAYTGENMVHFASGIASDLRRNNIPAEMDILRRPLRRQMEYAASKSVGIVLIVAPREYSEGKIVIRNMANGEEKKVAIVELVDILKSAR